MPFFFFSTLHSFHTLVHYLELDFILMMSSIFFFSVWNNARVTAAKFVCRRSTSLHCSHGNLSRRTSETSITDSEAVFLVSPSYPSKSVHPHASNLTVTAATNITSERVVLQLHRLNQDNPHLPPFNLYTPGLMQDAHFHPTKLEDASLVEGDEGKKCSSVLKKRRKKMNRHKYRKWRKRMTFKRRALKK